jgi:hypothetical protein
MRWSTVLSFPLQLVFLGQWDGVSYAAKGLSLLNQNHPITLHSKRGCKDYQQSTYTGSRLG